MGLLLTIQSAIEAATPWLASAAAFFALMALGARIAERRPHCEALAQFKRLGLLWQVFIVLSVGSVTRWAAAKGDRGAPSQPSEPSQVVEPSIAPVAVYTNGVSFVTASSNAVELATWRTIGGTEMGAWIESPINAPFFAISTNPIYRAYASASGAISFESMRRPPVGQLLPDRTARPEVSPHLYPVLCPLRTPLGFVPKANCGGTSPPGEPQSPRFWHDALSDGGRVFTWENALVDRLPNRRVSMQVEMRPSGDCVFRYDFQKALDPPATNFVIGAQVGTNGVNALAILGTNILSATVWNVDGAPVTNDVAIADLLCTNGVLRTPATFEIRWRNTSGLDSVTDSDGDGLTDWEEVFVWNTYPNVADTAWAATLADCTPTNWMERGFWIWLNTNTGLYEAGETVLGEPCSGNGQAYVVLPPRPSDIPTLPSPTASGARYPVASFHTHPPAYYRTKGRDTGPSPDDERVDRKNQVPGLVYDYIGWGQYIGAGHPINAPARIYQSLGLGQRPTP